MASSLYLRPRTFGLRMLAVKNSTQRRPAWRPRASADDLNQGEIEFNEKRARRGGLQAPVQRPLRVHLVCK